MMRQDTMSPVEINDETLSFEEEEKRVKWKNTKRNCFKLFFFFEKAEIEEYELKKAKSKKIGITVGILIGLPILAGLGVALGFIIVYFQSLSFFFFSKNLFFKNLIILKKKKMQKYQQSLE